MGNCCYDKICYYYTNPKLCYNKLDLSKSGRESEKNANKKSGLTLKKYRTQVALRRQRVRELFSRGYSQSEIAASLHKSQPTISRDLHYIKKEIHKNIEKNVERVYEAHWNKLIGLDEVIKKLWAIIDSARTNNKDRIKAITLVTQYTNERLQLIRSEPSLTDQKRYNELMKIKDLNL